MNSEKQSTNLQMTLREVNRVGEGQKNVPKLRFKGYEDAWEQRKLGEVSQIVGGGTPSTGIPEYWDGDIDWYSPAEIGEEIFVSCSQRKITQLGLEKSSAKILPVGTVLFTSRAGIGDTAILEKEGCTNQGFQSIVPKANELDSYFIFSCSHLLKKYGETKGAGSTFVEISGKQMSLMPLNIPEIKEQKSVGNFFRKLDSIITLHQRKYDALKSLKKTLLSKMFPKNEEDVPEIRFKGFTDAWEQRKLGAAISVKSGKDYKHLDEGDVPVYGTGGYMLSVSEALENTRDAIGIGRKGTIDKPFVLKAPFWTVDTLFYCIPKENNSLSFLYSLFQSVNWKLYDESTGVPSLSKTAIDGVTIKLTSEDEQSSIGECFESVDNLITLHQRKLDELKNMKKTLLQQMFV